MEIVLITSLLITVLILTLPKSLTVNASDAIGIQKLHTTPTPRLGGVPIFISFFIGVYLLPSFQDEYLLLLLASTPVFLGGVTEDITAKVTPLKRMITILISVSIAFVLFDVRIDSLGFSWVDNTLTNYTVISYLFTLLMIGGAVNSLNIIDGNNGLMTGYSMLATLAIAYVAYIFGDQLILSLSLLLAASLAPLFIINYPFGKIFIGDGGAYFIGFIIAVIGLMLADRHEELSNWFVLLIFIYPMYELLFSIVRRKFSVKAKATEPDALHLHSIIYKINISRTKVQNKHLRSNNMTSPFLWALSLVGIIPAIIWYENQTILIICAFVFMAIYTAIYYALRGHLNQ